MLVPDAPPSVVDGLDDYSDMMMWAIKLNRRHFFGERDQYYETYLLARRHLVMLFRVCKENMVKVV